jgi:hypothetical protein
MSYARYEAGNHLIGVTSTSGHNTVELALWAKTIAPHLQKPERYETPADLARRMRTDGGFLVAFLARDPSHPLAFAEFTTSPDNVVLFNELGVTWGPTTAEYAKGLDPTKHRAPEHYMAAAGALVLHMACAVEEDPKAAIMVRGYPGDTRSSEFFTQEVGLRASPEVGDEGVLYMATANQVVIDIISRLGIEGDDPWETQVQF